MVDLLVKRPDVEGNVELTLGDSGQLINVPRTSRGPTIWTIEGVLHDQLPGI
jgi:hypothetical protein